MKSLTGHTALEARAITYYWNEINSMSAKTNVVYEYSIDNEGYDIDAHIVKREMLPFGGSITSTTVQQEVKVRNFPSTDWKATGGLIMEKMKADKMSEGDLYTSFLKDCSVTYVITKDLLKKCSVIKKKMNKRTASDLQGSGEKVLKDVYLLPLSLGIKRAYD